MFKATFLLSALILVTSFVDGTVPSRKGRQWVGELESQSDCSFPVAALGRNGTTANKSPAERVSLCNFTTSGPLVDGVYPWQKGLASLGNWIGGPTTDASNSSDGGYAFFETSSLSVQQLPGVQAKAWLKSPVYQPTTPRGHCLHFSYNVQGVSASGLRLLRVQMVPLEGHSAAPNHAAAPLIVNSILMPTRQRHQRQAAGSDGVFASPWTPFQTILVNQTGWQEVVDEVWLSSDSTRGLWVEGHVTYSSPYPHAFIFEAVPNLSRSQYRGHVAVDDIKFSTGPCRAECEFNADFCQWSNDGQDQDDFDWSLSRGSLWTSTGPIRDQLSSRHNFNFGGYAFIDSRQPHFAGSRASLTSEVLPATSSSNDSDDNALCFVFWVHMFGAGIGRLRVLQKSAFNTSKSNDSAIEREIWQLSAQSGPRDSWYRAQVTLASSTPFKLRLEAMVGESGYGDIAIDSFRIENGSCPGLPEWAVNRGVDCTFQNDNCAWVLTNSRPGLTSMWTRTSVDRFAGRPDGHSQQNVLSHLSNSYLLFDTYQNGHKPGSRGFISSLLQNSSDPHCLSFWFYMASASPASPRLGALEVALFQPNTTSANETNGSGGSAGKTPSVVSTTLWRLEGHQEEKWLSAQVSFVASSGGYVSFVGIKGDGVRGVIAIDDITLYQGSCPALPLDAVVSQLDCSFDNNLCNWSVDSQTVPLNNSANSSSEVATETTTLSTLSSSTASSRSNYEAPDSSESKSATESDNLLIIFPMEDTSTTDYPLTPTTSDTILAFTDGGVLSIELIPSDTLSPTTETDTAKYDATTTTTEESTSTVAPTTVLSVTSPPTTTSTTATTTTPTTTSATTAKATSKVVLSNTTKSDNVNKDSAVRGVSGLYDEITSFGANTIEVISTSRDGATKSIIISQPGRSRFRRNSHGKWVGYNDPRKGKIVNHRSSSAPDETGQWRRPMPVPAWLRPRQTSFEEYREEGRLVINPHTVKQNPNPAVFPSFQRLTTTSSRPINQPSTSFRPLPVATFSAATTTSGGLLTSGPIVKAEPQWILSSPTSSLYGVRDHTLQLAEGGYVFLEGTGKSSVSRLFSPPLSGNATYCLSFFFTMAYNSPNTTLTVYRFDNGPLNELWRVTWSALDRSGNRLKSPWIPARVPIPSDNAETNQTIVIEGSTDNGGIALDDIRLKQISCSIRP